MRWVNDDHHHHHRQYILKPTIILFILRLGNYRQMYARHESNHSAVAIKIIDIFLHKSRPTLTLDRSCFKSTKAQKSISFVQICRYLQSKLLQNILPGKFVRLSFNRRHIDEIFDCSVEQITQVKRRITTSQHQHRCQPTHWQIQVRLESREQNRISNCTCVIMNDKVNINSYLFPVHMAMIIMNRSSGCIDTSLSVSVIRKRMTKFLLPDPNHCWIIVIKWSSRSSSGQN